MFTSRQPPCLWSAMASLLEDLLPRTGLGKRPYDIILPLRQSQWSFSPDPRTQLALTKCQHPNMNIVYRFV